MSKEQRKIVYSLRVVKRLLALGYQPIATLDNPVDPKFKCWAFEPTQDFLLALDGVLSEVSDYGR